MGGVRADAAILFPLILDRIADERSSSDLCPVSCTLELMTEPPPYAVLRIRLS